MSTTITSTTTTTNKSSPKKSVKSSKETDINNPTLTSKPALAFWAKHFPDNEESVSRPRFYNALLLLFKEQKQKEENKKGGKTSKTVGYNIGENTQKQFAKAMVTQIFWPAVDLTENRNRQFVDKSCIQFAINTFGPWSTLFQTIDANLEDLTQPHKPLEFFHGRVTREQVDIQLNAVGDFALRYDQTRGVVLHWAREGRNNEISPRHETLIRKKFPKKAAVWTWADSIAVPGGMKVKKHQYKSIGEFLDYMRGKNGRGNNQQQIKKISNAIMFGSAYDTFIAPSMDDDSEFALKAEIDKHIPKT